MYVLTFVRQIGGYIDLLCGDLRLANGMTQKALAEKLQLIGGEFSDLTVLRIENGTRFVPDYEVKALAEVFGVSYEALLDDADE